MTHLQGMTEEEDDDLFTQIERRLRYTVKEANKRYWVGDNFNGYDEFKCTEELSFNEFREIDIRGCFHPHELKLPRSRRTR